ncbi:MAG TPA: ABC transporter substrate-binding protein [Tepidisphaeraceae bacterium]|nr:ABC transporter substrate-binding protein [Tepidisphaeraceae bacterium]
MRKFFGALAIGLAAFALPASALAQDILVGHYGSLTGSEATFGQSTSNGIKLAISEINGAGGINGKMVKLVEYDTKGDAREAGAVVTRLVTADKVSIVLGEVASSLSLAGAPVCQSNQVPMISPSSTNPRVTLVGDYIFRVCFIDEFQGYVAAKFATESKKAKRIAILQDQASAYSVGLADFFQKYLQQFGGDVTTRQSYNAGDQDFTARLTAIRGTNPDMIYVPGYYTDVANIAIQARKLGINVPLLGGDGWDSAKLTEIGGKSIEGSFFSNHAAPDEPAMVDFSAKYRDEYGADPDALAALGYDAAMVAFDAIKRAKSHTGPAIRDALKETKLQGVTGMIAFDGDRNTTKDAVMVEVKDGKLVMAERIKPSN